MTLRCLQQSAHQSGGLRGFHFQKMVQGSAQGGWYSGQTSDHKTGEKGDPREVLEGGVLRTW